MNQRTPPGTHTARALSAAFLGAPHWTVDALVAHGRRALDPAPDWLAGVAAAAVEAWREPPRDAPREFARFLLAVRTQLAAVPPAYDDEEDLPPRPAEPRVRAWLPAATAMGRTPWPVHPLHDLADVAELLGTDLDHLAWYADPQGRQRHEPAGHLQLYRRRWLARPGRVPRLLEVPTPRLRAVQRVLLDAVLAPIPAHPAAHGFVPGRSALTGARQHVGADVVLTMDLAAFFATVTAGRVWATLRTAGYPEPVATLLTGLCTTRATRDDLATMPGGGTDAARDHARAALARPHLPQGAPTSPQLANLAAHRLDRRLDGLAAAAGAAYTRYADDLSFSGGRGTAALRDRVAGIVVDEGFAVQPAKTRVRGRGARQTVTGVVVNERTSLPRAELDALRARLTNAVRRGPSAADLAAFDGDVHALRRHLTGRVAWVAQVHPARGERLAALLADVDWGRRDTSL
ncbi:Reverse transcriptase (RNA-dependent DNA polymerase) [Klenkia soli]|uniref:RNA-directed DNA polymerase n=1 Tax=Klenkia soli TaxID=1052260 RepID=A0A1H0R193_9ACTN|nr:reverse transcriptase family protein [Klenkia soli]SDP22929.1 Reverse transcriptase (RNA-dependent DNA polymerase) [Klenkia soli]